MGCASCGRANQPGARFCGGCGKPLVPRCPACGAAGEQGASFCQACGASLGGPAPEEAAARKVVTIVFADLIGSTALHERLDPESVRRFMNRYYDAMRTAVEAEHGTVTQLLGDGVKAVFGEPRVAEDDAIRAVRAAMAMQRAFRELAEGQRGLVGHLGLRVAVNTGEVVASAEQEIIGDPVNVAARLQEEARDGDVVIAEPTRRLVGELVTLVPLGAFTVKGRAEQVSAYRVVSLERPAGASGTAFVGRESELARIREVYDDVMAARRARLVVILGSPGLGKSRLIGEVTRRLRDGASVLFARCDPAGGATFAPVAAALRALLPVDDGARGDVLRAAIHAAASGDPAERARIASGIAALLEGTPGSPEETFFVVRRFLTGLASAAPAVLVIDDLQWAEPLLLDLVEHLVQWTSEAPLLLLVGARPELREARSSLTVPGGLVADVVTLAGLDAAAATRLAANTIGADELPAAVAGRVLTASEGNPLFVGELVRMLVQDGVLHREGERWTTGAALAALEMPPTIQALLAARIERLRPEERMLLERAAVVGRQFSRAAVAELLPREVADLDRHLEALRRSEFVEPDTGWFLGEPALRFHHVLTRDAAYRGLLKNRRAELHERFADWVVRRLGDAAPHDETIGWHLEQAHRNLAELGPIDPHGRELGERAARYLAAAGRRALERDDVPVAASLLGRALARLDEADPERADLALDWCEALLSAGEVGAAAAAIDELGRFAHASPRLRAWHTCFAGQRAALTDPESLRGTADAVAVATETLAAEGDSAGEAKGHFVHAMTLQRLGRVGACEAALDRALAAARRVGDRRRASTVQAVVPLAALWGPSPVTRASGKCLDVVRVLRITQSAPAVEAVALRCQGVLEVLRGRSEPARRMVASSRRMVEELGITQRLLEADLFAGRIELIEGDALAAERCLRAAYEGLRQHGLGIAAAQAAALLGRALLALERAGEAEALSHESEKLAGDDLEAAIAWRGVRAEALARRGESAAAVELARTAVDLAAATDALLFHADARLALAAALRVAGQGTEAAAEEARAIELWEAKGASRLAERARRETGSPAEDAAPEQFERARPTRRVRPNAATANAAGLERAVAARDADALEALIAEDFEQAVDHTTGATFGRDGALLSFRSTIRSEGGACRYEPLATLGDGLALSRFFRSASGTRWRPQGLTGKSIDVGAFETDVLHLLEGDARGRLRRCEIFPRARLGDAIVRVYERRAELLPDGPERERATATARAAAAVLGPYDPARYATAMARGIEYVDHRMQGAGPLTGREAVLEWLRSLLEVAEDVGTRIDDVLALRPDALLLRWTDSGRERVGSGTYERRLLWLGLLGPDGLFKRVELFEDGREVEALSRFDELLAAPPPRRVRRRVRANAATAQIDRANRVLAARDADALPALLSDGHRALDHKTGVILDGEESTTFWRMFLADQDAALQLEPLAALGDSLALTRVRSSGTASSDPVFGVGPFEAVQLSLLEVDARGRFERVESFDGERLGVAVVRLYERHAELLPEGPERERAVAIARSVAAYTGPLSVEPDTTNRFDDVLELRPGAFLIAMTNLGTDRTTGGAFERQMLRLVVFGSDGLVVRSELFDADREDEALTRFDELVATPRPRRRVRPNAATAHAARLDAAVAARDAGALSALFSDGSKGMDHITDTAWEEQGISAWRSLALAQSPSCRHEPLATLGASLALCRLSLSASGLTHGDFEVGAYQRTDIQLIEVDAQGRRRWGETFATERLGVALARLHELYAESLPEGSARARAAGTARSLATWTVSFDVDRIAGEIEPDVEMVDRRILGSSSARGADATLQETRSWYEVAAEVALVVDDILALEPDAQLLRVTMSGTELAEGGRFERPFLLFLKLGAAGRPTSVEILDVDREAEALARFDELSAKAAPPWFENTASRAVAEAQAAWNAGDWTTIEGLYPSDFRMLDRRRMVQLELDRDRYLESMRLVFEMDESVWLDSEVLATRGDRLALARYLWRGSGRDAGPTELEYLFITEVDERGQRAVTVRFEADDLDAAYAELDARYAEGEAAGQRSFGASGRAVASRDWEALAAALAPELVAIDHRRLGWETMHGPAAYIASLRALVELAPDSRLRIAHDRSSERARLTVATWLGTREGGDFELPRVVVAELDRAGRISRYDFYDPEQMDEARARFAELLPDPLWIPPNAATGARDRSFEALAAQDWDAMRALAADDFRFEDRGRKALVVGGIEHLIGSLRFAQEEGARASRESVGTTGDRIVIERILWIRDPAAGALEVEGLIVTEVDADGSLRATVRFDPDDRRAAFDEAAERFLAGEAATVGGQAPIVAMDRAIRRRDWTGVRACLAPDAAFIDRRAPSVLGSLDRDRTVESLQALADLADELEVEPARILAWNGRGRADLARMFATREDGPVARVFLTGGDRIRRFEVFDAGDAEQALARFAELCAP